MRTYSFACVVSFTALAASIGFGAAWVIKDVSDRSHAVQANAVPPFLPEAPSPQPIVQRVQQAVVRATRGAPASFDDALDRALVAHRGDPDPEAWYMLMQTLQTDTAARARLIRRYEQERVPHARELLQMLLQGNAAPEVRDVAARLASSADVSQRREGFSLMASLPPTAESYHLIKQALEQEQDPTVLSSALLNLVRPAAIDPAESRAIVERLSSLAQNSDPNVRSTSLMALLQWDKTGETVVPNVDQGLSDREPQVRQAALEVIISGHLHSETFKTPLFDILRNVNEDPWIRVGSLHALNNFTLSDTEYALYQQWAPEIEQLTQEQKLSGKTGIPPSMR